MDSDAEEFVTAAHRGDVAVLSEALECCASSEERMNLANAANADGTTALYLASQMGHDDAVLLLLDNGAALDKGREHGLDAPLRGLPARPRRRGGHAHWPRSYPRPPPPGQRSHAPVHCGVLRPPRSGGDASSTKA